MSKIQQLIRFVINYSNICEIGCFHDCKKRVKISYAVLQIISQELQIEYVKKSAKVTGITQNDTEKEVQNKIKETAISVNSIQSNKSMITNNDTSVTSNCSKQVDKTSIQISVSFLRTSKNIL